MYFIKSVLFYFVVFRGFVGGEKFFYLLPNFGGFQLYTVFFILSYCVFAVVVVLYRAVGVNLRIYQRPPVFSLALTQIYHKGGVPAGRQGKAFFFRKREIEFFYFTPGGIAGLLGF